MQSICTPFDSYSIPLVLPPLTHLLLLLLLLHELPVLLLATEPRLFDEMTHLMKSASSELEALIGGLAAAACFLGPEVA